MKRLGNFQVELCDHNRRFKVGGFEITVSYAADSNVGNALTLDHEVIPAIQRGLALIEMSDAIRKVCDYVAEREEGDFIIKHGIKGNDPDYETKIEAAIENDKDHVFAQAYRVSLAAERLTH
jgi:hypothetical protein